MMARFWEMLRRLHPRLYEAAEWGMLALSAGAFALALIMFLERSL